MLKRVGLFILDMLELIFLAAGIFLFLYLLVLQPHKIKGSSMHPNYPDGEYLLTDKVNYRFNEPKRGDVVVFKAPIAPDEEYIKRIIGLPGDTVGLKDGKIYINGNQLDESYLKPELITSGGAFLAEGSQVTVPAGDYFVLGDNRPYSSDSRSWGFIKKSDITGRAWVVYWPVSAAGKVQPINYSLN